MLKEITEDIPDSTENNKAASLRALLLHFVNMDFMLCRKHENDVLLKAGILRPAVNVFGC